jgi:hypothetical protein
MISLRHLNRRVLSTVLFAAALSLSGCITSNELLLDAATTPLRAGKYKVQYHVDGKWTKFAAGTLALANRTYTWTENREVSSLLNSLPREFKFTLVDIGSNYFIIVFATADLRNPIWAGNYMYGIARRAGGTLLYDLPSCLDLLVSQGLSDYQIDKIGAYECQYSKKASLTSALTAYARRTVIWKRLAPSGQ